MEEKSVEFFENYNLAVLDTSKTRGAFRILTDLGMKLLLPYGGSENRAVFEQKLLERLTASGFSVDKYVANKEGLFVTKDEFGDTFLMKDWFDGEECNARKQEQACAAVKNLAAIHTTLTGITEYEGVSGVVQVGMREMFEKRNRELRRTRTFLREKHRKGYFETVYINIFPEFYEKAAKVTEHAKAPEISELLRKACTEGRIFHGTYTHHNLLMNGGRVLATVNFDKAGVGVQIADFYLFFRKLMEKTDWNMTVAKELIEAYESERRVEAVEWRYFYLLLSYPEKFWKITNSYYNGKKAWIPEKTTEKLLAVKEQDAAREALLKEVVRGLCG